MTQRQSQVNVLGKTGTNLLSIREFASICKTTPRTIRFYDQKDLLKPSYIDEWTKYRYYTPEQARDFLMIKFMQNFHLPLNEIKLNIELKSNDEYFEERILILKKEIEEKEKEYKFLSDIKKLFFEEQKFETLFKREEIGPFSLFCLKVENGSYDNIHKYRQEIRIKAREIGLKFENRDIVTYFDKDFKPKKAFLELSLILKSSIKQSNFISEEYSFRVMPKIKALTFEYEGPEDYFIILYQKLFDYLDKYKIKLSGSNFDINIGESLTQKSAYDFKSKLVFPVN